jgi:hypothetical protein
VIDDSVGLESEADIETVGSDIASEEGVRIEVDELDSVAWGDIDEDSIVSEGDVRSIPKEDKLDTIDGLRDEGNGMSSGCRLSVSSIVRIVGTGDGETMLSTSASSLSVSCLVLGSVTGTLILLQRHSALPYSVEASDPQISQVTNSVEGLLEHTSAVLNSVTASEAHFSAVRYSVGHSSTVWKLVSDGIEGNDAKEAVEGVSSSAGMNSSHSSPETMEQLSDEKVLAGVRLRLLVPEA